MNPNLLAEEVLRISLGNPWLIKTLAKAEVPKLKDGKGKPQERPSGFVFPLGDQISCVWINEMMPNGRY